MSKEIASNYRVPKFSVGDKVKITKYEKIFSKGYNKNWSKEIFAINSLSWTTDDARVDTSNLAPEKDFIALKAGVGKLGILELMNIRNFLSSLKTQVDNLDLNKLKTVPVHF